MEESKREEPTSQCPCRRHVAGYTSTGVRVDTKQMSGARPSMLPEVVSSSPFWVSSPIKKTADFLNQTFWHTNITIPLNGRCGCSEGLDAFLFFHSVNTYCARDAG